jgi:hypothetical protein
LVHFTVQHSGPRPPRQLSTRGGPTRPTPREWALCGCEYGLTHPRDGSTRPTCPGAIACWNIHSTKYYQFPESETRLAE